MKNWSRVRQKVATFSSKRKIFSLVAVYCSVSFGSLCQVIAKEIEFPEEEIASESVLPVFDFVQAVNNRNVVTDGRLAFHFLPGINLIEPFLNPISVAAGFLYHFSETHALGLMYGSNLPGQTTYANQLSADGLLNLDGAPASQFYGVLNYQYSPWYGKISLSKQSVSNLHLYLLGGLGVVNIGGSISPSISTGIGQKFYFSKRVSLRIDLRLFMYSGPDPLSVEINDANPAPDVSEFSTKFYLQPLLSIGLSFLI